MTTLEAVGIFVLSAVPGVIALEIVGYGRPPLRSREAGATLRSSALPSRWVWCFAWRPLCVTTSLKVYTTA